MTIRKADYERLMNQARVKLTGASEGGLKGELFDVINEFFQDANCWVESIAITIINGVQDYTLIPQQGGLILRLVGVYDNNQITYPAFLEDVGPSGASLFPGGNLHLVWPQQQNSPVQVPVTKTIILPNSREDIPDAPDWLFPKWGLKILDGLLGKMMTQQNKSYSDQTTGTYHLKRFRDGIQIARVAAMRSNLYGGQAWRFPTTFRQSSQRGSVSTAFPAPTSW